MKMKLFPNKSNAYNYVANKIAKLIDIKPDATLGLWAHSDLIELYSQLGKVSKEQDLDYSQVKLFNIDNQLDSSGEKMGSSFAFMKDHLYKKLTKLKKAHAFFPEMENNYDQLIEQNGQIDLLILTLTNDGSVGFNFSGSVAKTKTRKVFDTQIKSGVGLTMGLETMLKAKSIILIVLGKEKSVAFRKLKNLHKFEKNFPISLVKEHDNVQVIVDEEAF